MGPSIWVKVVGFNDAERHSLNTLFRLSARRTPSYVLWSPEAPTPPHVGLVDLDSYEGGLELVSPRFNPNLKLICIGGEPPSHVWRAFERPIDWNALVQVLDGLFITLGDAGIDIDLDAASEPRPPPGVRVTLLLGQSRHERLYLRARLALAGITEVDEAQDAAQAAQRMAQRHYDLVLLSLQLPDADPWGLVDALQGGLEPPRSLIVTSNAPSWAAMERAERCGCLGLLEIPFDPKQVLGMLERV
ncbi:MAG: response regulator [Rhodoferax sp.]